MSATVNRNAVCVWSKESLTNLFQIAVALIEDRNDAALGRYVESAQTLIKGEHVRIGANRLDGRQCLCFKIKDRQLSISLTGNKCQPVFAVDEKTMAFAATRQRVTGNDFVPCRIDLR